MTTRKKVLIVEQAPALGGSLTSIELVIRHGYPQGFDFGVLCAPQLHRYLPAGVTAHALPPPGRGLLGLWDQHRATMRCLRDEGYDALILNNLLSENFPAVCAGLRAGLPCVQFARAYERRALSWRVLSPKVDAFVPVSQSVGNTLIALGAPAQKLHMAYEGIAPQPERTQAQRRLLRERLQLDEQARILGFVGRLVAWKGLALFVEAALASMAHHENTHALIVGGASESEGALLKDLRARIEDEGMSHRVHWCGEVTPEQIPSLMGGMDAFLHTSLTPEPFGRVLLEAMAKGTPVLSSAMGGPREIITDRRDGVLTAPGDVAALVAGIEWLFAEEGRAEALGQRGRQMVRERFHEEACAGPVLSCLHSLLQPQQKHATEDSGARGGVGFAG